MGRSSGGKNGITDHPSLWPADELPEHAERLPETNFKSLRFPVWTQSKASLIQTYLRLFEMITHHGAYIDGFAAPQDPNHPDICSAKLVLEMEPKWFRDFWLCDVTRDGVVFLKKLQEEHSDAKRHVTVLEGDFNQCVDEVLRSGRIKESVATFALLDQRTFECHWETVARLSRHKKRRKIEIFYFFPTGWIDRALAAVKTPSSIENVGLWWGRDDWQSLRGMDKTERAMLVAKRFEDELGYRKAKPYAIHSEELGGRVMYHMIHATDHPDAPLLMIRAYRKVAGRPDLTDTEQQRDFEELWNDLRPDEE